jgi:hypothetical protein
VSWIGTWNSFYLGKPRAKEGAQAAMKHDVLERQRNQHDSYLECWIATGLGAGARR